MGRAGQKFGVLKRAFIRAKDWKVRADAHYNILGGRLVARGHHAVALSVGTRQLLEGAALYALGKSKRASADSHGYRPETKARVKREKRSTLYAEAGKELESMLADYNKAIKKAGDNDAERIRVAEAFKTRFHDLVSGAKYGKLRLSGKLFS